MKKFITLLLAVLVYSSNFQVKCENVLLSKSFEVTYLDSMVSGDVTDVVVQNFGVRAKFTVKNITSNFIDFTMRVENIKIQETHLASFCYGTTCKAMYPNTPQISVDEGIETGVSTAGTYIDIIFNIDKGEIPIADNDTLRVTVTNQNLASDFVSFIMIWDFSNGSVKIIEDISHKVYPNPTFNFLNFTTSNNFISNNEQEFDAVEIFDVSGNKVINKVLDNGASINVSYLETGTYLGYLTKSGRKVKTFRFVKN